MKEPVEGARTCGTSRIASVCQCEARASYSAYSGAGVRSGFFSRSSVSVASVNSNVLATETAFSSATRTTLVASMMPASIKSTYLQVEASRPEFAFAGSHAIHHHAAVQRRVFGDLTRGCLERSFENPQTGLFVLFGLGFLSIYGIDRAQQGQSGPWQHSFGDGRFGGADGVLESFLQLLGLGLRRRADANDGNSARQLRQPLLQFLLVVLGGGLLNLLAQLAATAIDR